MCQWCNDCFGGRCNDVDTVCTGRDLCHGQSQTVVNADGCRRLTQSQCVTLDCTDCINTDGCVWMQHDVFQHLSGMCAYSLMLWNLHIGMCTLMSLITHLHGLHLNVQYVQTGVITCWHNCTVQRRLVVKHTIVSFVTDQWPCYASASSQRSLSHMVAAESFQHRSGYMSCKSLQIQCIKFESASITWW